MRHSNVYHIPQRHLVRWTKIFESTGPLNLIILYEGNIFATFIPTSNTLKVPNMSADPLCGHVTPLLLNERRESIFSWMVLALYVMVLPVRRDRLMGGQPAHQLLCLWCVHLKVTWMAIIRTQGFNLMRFSSAMIKKKKKSLLIWAEKKRQWYLMIHSASLVLRAWRAHVQND